MARNAQWVRVSGYLFLLGILVAIVAGILGSSVIPYTSTILVVLGAIVGLLGALGWGSISKNNSEMFLLATIALAAAGSAGAVLSAIPTIGAYLAAIVNNIFALVAPAAVIIAVEAIWRAGSVKL